MMTHARDLCIAANSAMPRAIRISRVTCAQATRKPERLSHPEKITLADFDAVVAQNSMRGRGMEIKIRKGETIDEFLALQRQGIVRANREGDLLGVGAFELRRLERLHIVDGFGDPLLEFIERLFGVGRGRHLAMGEAGAALGCEIAGGRNLLRQWQYMRREPRAERRRGREIPGLAMGLSLG